MGDKPSVEAKSFQSEIDGCHPGNVQDNASTSSGDCESLTCVANAGGAAVSVQPDGLVNGVWCSSPVVPGPRHRMKQSKSANYSINGETGSSSQSDAKRSLSVDAKLTAASEQLQDVSAVDNSELPPSHSESAINPVPVEPSSPSSSSTVTVLSVVHADGEARHQKSGH